MILVALSVYDEVADFYSPPFFVKTVNEGLRVFNDACKDSRSGLSEHPEDVKLFKVGIFDDSKGSFISCEPHFLTRGIVPVTD